MGANAHVNIVQSPFLLSIQFSSLSSISSSDYELFSCLA